MSEQMTDFERQLRSLINKNSMENGSNTPDLILARFLTTCLEAFDAAVVQRENWYGEAESKQEKTK